MELLTIVPERNNLPPAKKRTMETSSKLYDKHFPFTRWKNFRSNVYASDDLSEKFIDEILSAYFRLEKAHEPIPDRVSTIPRNFYF